MDERRTQLAQFPLQGWWERADSCLNKALKNGKATEALYGEDFKVRQALHQDIIDEYIELALQYPTDNKGVIIGGLPSSGKSLYVATHCPDYAVVSPDIFKEILIERELVPDIETVTPMETGSLCHMESSRLAKQFFFELIALGVNVVLDFTMNYSDSVVKRVTAMKDLGYFTESILMNIPKTASISRTQDRHLNGVISFLEGEGLGGRYVPIGYINNSTPDNCFVETRKWFHKSYVYDATGTKPVLDKSW